MYHVVSADVQYYYGNLQLVCHVHYQLVYHVHYWQWLPASLSLVLL